METNRKRSPEKNSGNSVLRSEASLVRVNEEYTNENTRNIRGHIFSEKLFTKNSGKITLRNRTA